MLISGFHSDTDYYSFVNTLYKRCDYETRGANVYIKNPPDWIWDVIKYFELSVKESG